MRLSFVLEGALLCALGVVSIAGAQTAQADPAGRRAAAHLQHGINTSIWFAQAPGRYTEERLRTFTTVDDFKLIHRVGFDHIRLSVDATPLIAWENKTPDGQMFMRELDRVVAEAMANHLAVIVDVHPESEYKRTLLTGDDGVQGFVAMWGAVAEHFRTQDPERVFFEIMNEPEQTDAKRWQAIETRAAQRVREVAPGFTIIASGAKWDGLDDMLALEPLPLDNVVYTFHDYEPFPFTHQGATWTTTYVRPLRAVPYPSTPDNVAPNLAQEPTLEGQMFVEQYGLGRWDAERIDRTIAFAQKWGELHHVSIYCGEFGVHRPYAQAADRDRWIHDTRVALEKHGIGWAMWDYQTNFGVVTKQNGTTTVDEGVVEALGLRGGR